MARPANAVDLIPKNLKALRGALEHSVTIQMGRLQEVVDELVARGTLTRAEADKLVGQLVTSGRAYSQALLEVLDSVTSEARKNVGAGVATAVAPVMSTAGKIAGTVRGVSGKKPAKQVPSAPSAPSSPPASSPAADPVPDLSGLTVAQVKPRLAGLSDAELRRVRQAEARGKARKGVLAEIDRLST